MRIQVGPWVRHYIHFSLITIADGTLDQKTKAHVEKAVKHRAPGIEATVNKYNVKRKEMLRERGKNGVRRDAYIPPELSMEGLYKLDVDQDIWENADMADFEGGQIPLWLADKDVRDGIRAAQEIKSCQEELRRCEVEYSNLRGWFVDEYEAVHNVFKFSNGEKYLSIVVCFGTLSIIVLSAFRRRCSIFRVVTSSSPL